MTDRRQVAVVLEDDGGVRQLLDAILHTEGWQRVLGSCWEEVRGAAEWADVLLVDQQLPGTQGVDVVREIRQRRPNMKVVMLTGDRHVRERAELVGVDGFLLKPFDVTDLIELLRDPGAEDTDEIDVRRAAYADLDLRTAETPWFSKS